jgi:predicted nucleic acid-binding protein
LVVQLLARVRTSPTFEFVPASEELFDRGAELFASRPDKSWSMVDCISFIVMRREGISDALTGDHHFVQAGFRAILTEDAKLGR